MYDDHLYGVVRLDEKNVTAIKQIALTCLAFTEKHTNTEIFVLPIILLGCIAGMCVRLS